MKDHRLYCFLFLIFLMASCKHQKTNPLLVSGVSLELANFRKQQVSHVFYNLHFSIPKNTATGIHSKLTLDLTINTLSQPLYLDFKAASHHLKELVINQKSVSIDHQEDHLIIAPKHLRKGSNRIAIIFDAGELSLNRNADYLYTLLVPDRASTLFPCFDQPNIKARYKLNITAPKDWEVLSAAKLDFKKTMGEFTTHQFKSSDRMSTYLFSFVAGVFQKTKQETARADMTLLYRENNHEKIAASVPKIFDLHTHSRTFLEAYTQYKFPFQKLDIVTIPSFQYGGMEHVGAIQYRESILFLEEHALEKQRLRRCKLIAHEVTHMWFGNLVTMNWFDDVWLKEVFANFLADKIVTPEFPDINHRLNFLRTHYPSAYSEDRTQGSNPIKQKLNNLKNAGTLYGAIIYNKAPIMMRQLEVLVGKKLFRNALREYVKKFAYQNADWQDLIALLDAQTDQDLETWSRAWVYQPGRPIINDSVRYSDNKITYFEINQQAENASQTIWPQQFSIGLIYENHVQVVPIRLSQRKQTFPALVGQAKPQAIIYNYDAFGYGVFPLNKPAIHKIAELKDDVARGYSYINLYENTLAAQIAPIKAIKVLERGLKTEQNSTVLDIIASRLERLFWKYIPTTLRDSESKLIENQIRTRLLAPETSPDLKNTLFRAFKNMAYMPSGRETLYRIWNKSLVVDQLQLSELDFVGMAYKLAIYKHPESSKILEKTMVNIQNPDLKKAFKFMQPSLSNDPKVRADFMQSLSQPEQREKEYWVTIALSNIHHPLRQEFSKKYLMQCLDLLEEIQRTGDIFFPKSWLQASIGNYSSTDAYDVLQDFLKRHPDFPKSLKNKLLQSADALYRAKKTQTIFL